MKRFAVRSLVIALAFAGSASAQEYYEQEGYGYEDAYATQDAGYYSGQDDQYYAEQGDQYGSQSAMQYTDGYSEGPAYRGQADAYGDQGSAYDVAQVIAVDPIVERSQPVNRQQCWSEPTQVYARNDYRRAPRPTTSGGGAVLGAIVGGVIGNNLSERHDRGPATVAGAVIGGVIGNGIERRNTYGQGDGYYRNGYAGNGGGYYASQPVQRCRVVTTQGGDEHVVGYRVSYAYGGRQYETVTDYHPGSEIRVRVQVTPEG